MGLGCLGVPYFGPGIDEGVSSTLVLVNIFDLVNFFLQVTVNFKLHWGFVCSSDRFGYRGGISDLLLLTFL